MVCQRRLVFHRHRYLDSSCRSSFVSVQTLERPRTISEVFYAGPKSKSFRLCPFEFCQARFTLLKDTKVTSRPWLSTFHWQFLWKWVRS